MGRNSVKSDELVSGGSVVRGRGVAHDRVEAVVVISRVLYPAHRAVGFQQRVLAVHSVAVTALLLRLVVTGVSVGHRVREVVFGVSLLQ